jgi:hypothetical protein
VSGDGGAVADVLGANAAAAAVAVSGAAGNEASSSSSVEEALPPAVQPCLSALRGVASEYVATVSFVVCNNCKQSRTEK